MYMDLLFIAGRRGTAGMAGGYFDNRPKKKGIKRLGIQSVVCTIRKSRLHSTHIQKKRETDEQPNQK